MSLFGSLLGAGVSLLGSQLGARQSDRGAQAASQAFQQSASPFSVRGPFGSSVAQGQGITQNLSPELARALGLFSSQLSDRGNIADDPAPVLNPLNIQGIRRFQQGTFDTGQLFRESDARLHELRQRAAPQEAAQREALRNAVFSQGRLGLGVGGGQNNANFNPELASLEEGLARADIGRQDQALGLAMSERERAFRELAGVRGLISGLRDENIRTSQARQQSQLGALGGILGITGNPMQASMLGNQASRPLPGGIAAMQAAPFAQRARSTESFFSGLGTGIADSGLFGGGFFGGGGQALPISPGVFGPQ